MDTAKRNGKSDPISDIFPGGDIVLVVGPQKARLRISSQCLQSASKVFGTMFGPQWSGVQRLSGESPLEVPLMEDDADALRTICCVIHHRNDEVPQSLTPYEVLQIAIEADKYDLSVALKYASMQWLKPRGNTDRLDMGYLLAAAFLFRDMDMFVTHSLALILHYKGSYLAFLDDEITGQILPWKTFYLLEERRTRMRAELNQLLIEGKDAACSCGWGKNRGDHYTLLLSKYKPLTMLEAPVSDIVSDMKNVSLEDMKERFHSGGYSGRVHKAPAYGETLLGELEIMKNKASICLDCVQSDEITTVCSFKHK